MKQRWEISTTPEGVLLDIGPNRDPRYVTIGVTFVFVWTIWAVIGLRKAVDGTTEAFDAQRLLSSGLCVLLASGFALWVLWCLYGRERIYVRDGAWTVTRELLGIRKVNLRDARDVRNLRYKRATHRPFETELDLLRLAGGNAVLEYDLGTARFGSGLEEKDINQIIHKLKSHGVPI